MHTRLFDLLHEPGDVYIHAVGHGVDVVLDGAIEELVDQHRIGSGDACRFHHVPVQIVDILNELHRLTAQNVGRTQEHGVADTRRYGFGLRHCARCPIGGLLQANLMQELPETLAIFGQVDDVG